LDTYEIEFGREFNNAWSGKHLSKAGKEVLIKSVAQSIPAYCMSIFILLSTLGEEIQRMIIFLVGIK
jgi:hypothetical protein